ncbi:MAG: hypothetical protein IPK44_24175 [Candidatus Accumulibacter sp.]|uniref:hypothetical protein n=1 Tax=Accumulibacter sp. TaxID=2053492 RepID=UPI00258E4B30|nr:hypothetical protein [Accumulibacter sp.]MBK8117387.1 hypothetical protein [Accumulibacter sp.]
MSIRNVPMLPNLCDFGEKAADMLRQHPAEIAALRAIFDPATHAHRPDCCGPNIGTDCIGCAMAEREEYAAEIERLRSYVGNNMLMSDFRNVDGMRAEIARLTGESSVLRDLLRSALPVVETVSDDDSEAWMMATDLACRIKAAIDGSCVGLLEGEDNG